MIYQFRITPKASSDIIDIINWYNLQRDGLGVEFLLSFEAAIYNIKRAPLTNKLIDKKTRKALLSRFPYNVYYDLIGDKIVIFRVLHNKRHPNTWKKIYKRLD